MKLSRRSLVKEWEDDPYGSACFNLAYMEEDPEGEWVALKQVKEIIKLYGDHIGGCAKRPCTCGFQELWNEVFPNGKG